MGSLRTAARIPNRKTIFLALIIYRWVILTFVVVLHYLGIYSSLGLARIGYVITSVLVYNTLITVFHRFLMEKLEQYKFLFAVDVLMCGLFIGFTGGWRSPFYFYSFSPILLGVFLGQYKGGLIAAAGISASYMTTLYLNDYGLSRLIETGWLDSGIADNFSFFLIAVFFAIPSVLMDRLRTNAKTLERYRKKLEKANKQLLTLQKINLTMQSTVDLEEVLNVILSGITQDMGFDRAAIGFVDKEKQMLGQWMASREIPVQHYQDIEIPLKEDTGILAQTVLKNQAHNVKDALHGSTVNQKVLSRVESTAFAALPMAVGDEVLGVIMVDNKESKKPIAEAEMSILTSFAGQAAIAINNARLHKRNQELAVAEERNRIALEMHDSVVQTLSGAGLMLDASLGRIAGESAGSKERLNDVRKLIADSLRNIRYSIFNLRRKDLSPGLVSFFQKCTNEFGRANAIPVNFAASGRERNLSEDNEKNVCRILQEALANIRKHAHASLVDTQIKYSDDGLTVTISDDGCGFDYEKILADAEADGNLGIASMMQAAQDSGGCFNLGSSPGKGTNISVVIPISKD